MRRTLYLIPILLIAAAQVSTAQLSKSYADWAKGPEGFLLTVGDTEFTPRLLPTAEGTVPPMLQVGATVFNTLEEPPA